MRKMSQVPHELIRQVQISTRAAAGLSDYNPSDPTLPTLPPLSAAISASDPSPPHLRCKNCKARLLRGSESIICVYCGCGPHYDVVPDPICFTSTTGYQWLLRSLRLDGSEMVNLTNKSEQDQGQSSPKALIPLSDFLNFKIPWTAETEKQETSFSDKHAEERKGSLSLTGVAPDKFFLKSNRNVLSDTSTDQPFMHDQIGTAGRKDDATLDYQNLFHNVQSSEPAVSSSKHKTNEDFSKWEADFQSADPENQHGDHKPTDYFAGSSADSENKFQDFSGSFDHPKAVEVDLAAHIDSVFGPVKDLNVVKFKDNIAVTPAVDDWNSVDLWGNLRSNESQVAGGFDATVSTKDVPQGDHSLEYSQDLFQDFQSQTNYTDITENKTANEEHKTMDEDSFDEWNDFTGSTSLQVPSTSDQKLPELDLFSLVDNKFDKGDFSSFSAPTLFATSTSNSNALPEVSAINKIDEGDFLSFSQPNLFSTSTSNSNALAEVNAINKIDEGDFGGFLQPNFFSTSTSNSNALAEVNAINKIDEGDFGSFSQPNLFSTSTSNSNDLAEVNTTNKIDEGDFGGFLQPNLFSTSTSNSNALAEVNAIMSENPAPNWLSDAISPSHESGQAANNGDANEKSTKDEVKKLISQMHDLSFMLETELRIPSISDTHNSPPRE